jgi:hypothetical protein
MLKTVATDSVNACKLDLVSSSLERFRLTAVILDRELPDESGNEGDAKLIEAIH